MESRGVYVFPIWLNVILVYKGVYVREKKKKKVGGLRRSPQRGRWRSCRRHGRMEMKAEDGGRETIKVNERW